MGLAVLQATGIDGPYGNRLLYGLLGQEIQKLRVLGVVDIRSMK
jgi:hypothetical protein